MNIKLNKNSLLRLIKAGQARNAKGSQHLHAIKNTNKNKQKKTEWDGRGFVGCSLVQLQQQVAVPPSHIPGR